jgi:hypothetical protein
LLAIGLIVKVSVDTVQVTVTVKVFVIPPIDGKSVSFTSIEKLCVPTSLMSLEETYKVEPLMTVNKVLLGVNV